MKILPAFLRASRLLSRNDINDVEDVLQEWQKDGIGRTVAVNLHDREYFLPRRCMVALLRALIRAKGAALEDVAKQYQQECYLHQLRGRRIRVSPLPEQLGRAVDTEYFANYLYSEYPGHFPKLEFAFDFIVRLILGEIEEEDEALAMSKYTAWATWREDDPTTDPFSFVKHYLAVEVQAALGLDARLIGVLLLLRYRRPADLVLRRPTVADAGLFPHFDPPMSSEKAFSRTRPWPHFPIQHSPPQHGTADSHPEAVHSPVTMSYLSQAVDALP
jgi:hypothetical protein